MTTHNKLLQHDLQTDALCQEYITALWHFNEHNIIAKDFQTLETLLENEQVFFTVCTHPTQLDAKQKFLNALKIHFNDLTYKFIQLLYKNGHLHILEVIIQKYLKKYENNFGIIQAQFITAKICPEHILKQLEQTLIEKYKKEVKLVNVVHPKEIGGAILIIDGVQINASYKNILKNFINQINFNYMPIE